jgi:hypothetical protein
MYKCDYCNYTSNKINNVNLHNDIKHRDKFFQEKDINDIDLEEIESFICNKCNKSLSNKYNLKRHISNCKGIINPFQCQKCNKILSSISSKCRHTKTCKVKEQDCNPSIINNITNNNCNNTTNNNIINNTYIFQSNPNVHPLAYKNYSMEELSSNIIIPNRRNFPLMVEDFGRLIYNDDRNKNVKKNSNKTKYCLVKKENGEWCNKLDKNILPKVTKDIAYNFRSVTDDNEEELNNINKLHTKIIPKLREFLSILVDCNLELEILNDTDKEDMKLFNDIKDRIVCVIIDSSK